jgi:hypothetical protein
MFSAVQTFCCFWFYFNPLHRKKFKKWENCVLRSSSISAIAMLGVVPLAQCIFNGIMYEAHIADCPVAVWIMTYLGINIIAVTVIGLH